MNATTDPLRARILAAARARPPRRPRPRWALGLALLAAAALPGLVWLWGGPAHTGGRPGNASLVILAGSLSLALLATWLATPRPRTMLPPSAARLAAVTLGVPVIVAAGLLAGHSVYADPFWRLGNQCFALTLAAAPWPLAALLVASARRDVFLPRLTGAALGAAAGAWASLAVEAWCPLADPVHVLRGHVAPLVLVALLGAALAGRFLRPSEA